MLEFKKNTRTPDGLYSIINDIELGDHIEVIGSDDPEKKPSINDSICGYVIGIYLKPKTSDLFIDLSMGNPFLLSNYNAVHKLRKAFLPVDLDFVTHYRKIPPAIKLPE